jgi:hypothetical protein
MTRTIQTSKILNDFLEAAIEELGAMSRYKDMIAKMKATTERIADDFDEMESDMNNIATRSTVVKERHKAIVKEVKDGLAEMEESFKEYEGHNSGEVSPFLNKTAENGETREQSTPTEGH